METSMHNLIEFGNTGEEIEMLATENSVIIFGSGNPTNEPIVARGPFVMNTFHEIEIAYKEYSEGKYGSM